MAPEDQDRRKQIMDAAQKVFSEKGFNGASIKDLAKAAKISPGLLYWYFKDKTDLFATLLSERIETILMGGLAENVDFELPPQEFLRKFGRFYLSIFEEPLNAAAFRMLIINTQSFPPAVRQVQLGVVNRVLRMLQDYFQHQIDAGRMRPCDTEMATRTYMGSIVAFLLLRHILQDKRTQELSVGTFVDGITDVVLHGILPQDKQ